MAAPPAPQLAARGWHVRDERPRVGAVSAAPASGALKRCRVRADDGPHVGPWRRPRLRAARGRETRGREAHLLPLVPFSGSELRRRHSVSDEREPNGRSRRSLTHLRALRTYGDGDPVGCECWGEGDSVGEYSGEGDSFGEYSGEGDSVAVGEGSVADGDDVSVGDGAGVGEEVAGAGGGDVVGAEVGDGPTLGTGDGDGPGPGPGPPPGPVAGFGPPNPKDLSCQLVNATDEGSDRTKAASCCVRDDPSGAGSARGSVDEGHPARPSSPPARMPIALGKGTSVNGCGASAAMMTTPTNMPAAGNRKSRTR
jgi:hypothetical protein